MSLKKVERQCFRVFFKSGMKMKKKKFLNFNLNRFIENHTCTQDIPIFPIMSLKKIVGKCFRVFFKRWDENEKKNFYKVPNISILIVS